MPAERATSAQPSWLPAFRDGDRGGMEAVYREFFPTVDRAVGRILAGADRDTVVHEVFFRIITSSEMRESFTGPSLASWLTTVAKNHAIDFARRRNREAPSSGLLSDQNIDPSTPEKSVVTKQVIERLRKRLPAKLHPVFQQRFVEQRSQKDAAETLGIPRTTLAYHEKRIRALLRRFAAEIES